MKRLFWLGTLSVLLLAHQAFAQTAPPTPSVNEMIPPGPLVVTRLPGSSAQWVIDYTYSNTPKAGEPSTLDKLKQAAQNDPTLAAALKDPQYLFTALDIRPVHVAVMRTGSTQHEETHFEQDYKGEKWSNGTIVVERKPNTPVLIATLQLEAQGDDFPEFAWVAKDNFTGIQTHDGRKCLAFKKDQYDSEGNFIGTSYAFVDFTTRFPEGYEIVFEVRKYTIMPPPSGELSMPDEFVAAGKAMMARMQKATPHLAAP